MDYTPNKKDQEFLFNYVRPADIHVRRDILDEEVYKKPVKIMEAQTGTILKETDIIRYKDIYGRIN